jgi:hypothetical protein
VTAEIAILNKTAVALAADSAVTISAGSDQQKIYDSEDKLFELSCHNAIGVMINSTMHFMEAPLPVLIKRYRETAPSFATVKAAAEHFLSYLNTFIQESPARIQDEEVTRTAHRVFSRMNERAQDDYRAKVFESGSQTIRPELIENLDNMDDFRATITAFLAEAYDRQIGVFERVTRTLDDAQFVGEGQPQFSEHQRELVLQIAEDELSSASADQRLRTVTILEDAMQKGGVGGQSTGLVVAGFGSEELFPTLISYELFGAFGGRLRFRQREFVDIDRDGEKARVLPFAQREMVERFLYGLDKDIERKLSSESKSAVRLISEKMLGILDMPAGELDNLRQTVREAEQEFNAGFSDTFDAIRGESRGEIEDMVEFMPKPEMARMAEALVNLTSIKRRVSRGFETVGGPIDVAVISRAEGFVWVSRKHYFTRELNERYFARINRNQPVA